VIEKMMKNRWGSGLSKRFASLLTALLLLGTLTACNEGTDIDVQSLQIRPSPVSAIAGSTVQLTATATYSNQVPTDVTGHSSWSSSNASVATVDATTGKLTAAASGTATITADFSGQHASATVTVTVPTVVSLALTPATASVPAGTTQSFGATGTLNDSTTEDLTASSTWTSSDTSIATINSDGTATGVSPGDATIMATCTAAANCNSVAGSAALHVTAATLTAIAITPRAPSIALGTTQQLIATGTYSDQSTHDLTSQVTWSSGTSTVAAVSPVGLVNSTAVGTSSMTATLGGRSSSPVILTVTPATLVSIAVTPASPSVGVGATQQLTATGTYSDLSTQDITSTVDWSSDNLSAATISGTGLVTGVAAGSGQISATAGSISSQPTAVSVVNLSTTLSLSASTLALNVSGTARTVSITNTGAQTAVNVTTNATSLPTGTTIQSTCAALSPSTTCVVTVTPGSQAGFAAGDTNPTPATVTISGTNTNTITLSVDVLTYGSVYQGGYIFSIDDTTPNTGSIGGKVVALTDQSQNSPWSSGSFVAIYGISETSTTSAPSPSSGQEAGMVACNGALDGACNTTNIVAHYSATQPPTNTTTYAAGVCSQTISGFSDWYLPAVCELGYDNNGNPSACGTSSSPAVQNIQSNLVDAGVSTGINGVYQTSTEYSGNPQPLSWNYVTQGSGNESTFIDIKFFAYSTRCVRPLTP
jgi:uncharacterized protein YjdB